MVENPSSSSSARITPQNGGVEPKVKDGGCEGVEPKVKEPEEMTQMERSAFAAQCKDIGNRGFKAGEWDYAVLSYQEGIRYLRYVPHDAEYQPDCSFDHGGQECLEKDSALAVDLYNNLSAALLKAGDAQEALATCTQALQLDPKNGKALFRKAQARLAQGEYDEASETARALLQVSPGNSDALQIIRSAEQGAKKAKQEEKALFTKMFS